MGRYVAALDFGTANSGVIWGPDSEEITSRFQFVNKTGGYAKTRTVILVRRSTMREISARRKIPDNIAIYGVSGGNTNGGADVYFGFNGVNSESAGKAVKGDRSNWVLFEYFKTRLADVESSGNAEIEGSDGETYSLVAVIGLFIKCLKVLTEKHICEIESLVKVDFSEIRWAVTMPTIWKDSIHTKAALKEAIKIGIGVDCMLRLEPEGVAASFATMISPNQNPLNIPPGMRYLVVDCGGGTTDIVAHEVQHDGRLEEMRRSGGKLLAGWDIDKRFWNLFAEKIAQGKIDDPYRQLVSDLQHDRTRYFQWLQLEGKWLRIKEQRLSLDYPDDETYEFEIPRWYQKWFENVCPALSENVEVDDDDVVSLKFTQKEIRDSVCAPVLDEIVSVAEEFAHGCQCRFDYVILAGGLSGLKFLQKGVQDMTARLGNGAKFLCEDSWKGHHECPGGSIMRGAAVLTVFGNMIQRIATRNYYYKLYIKLPSRRFVLWEALMALKGYYEKLGISEYKWTALSAEIERSLAGVGTASFDYYDKNGYLYVMAFVPICLKGFPAKLYVNDGVHRADWKDGMTTIHFYSSERTLSFDVGDRLDDVRDEGTLSVYCCGNKTVRIEIDFNESYQESTLEARVVNALGGETKMKIGFESKG